MWILPKSLISAFAQDTEALTLDSSECSQTCAQSLMRRSKPSPAKTYLREWKAGNLMRLRSGVISSPSLGSGFLDWWISSLEATRASPSAAPASEPERTTHDTCGLTSQMEFAFSSPECASSRMSRDTSRWDSPASSAIWKNWVTRCRGEYSARLNAVRRTSESGSSSWPTVTANEDSYRIGGDSQQSKCLSAMARRGEMYGPPAPVNPSTHGSRPESWATPEGMAVGKTSRGGNRKGELLLTGQVKAWATPQSRDFRSAEGNQDRWDNPERSRNLNDQMKAWATPRTGIRGETHYSYDRGKSNIEEQAGASVTGGGKLNPRWVETLMGLPVGWTMPSCAQPVTIGQTSCASSATE